jgi:hypothetical protein
MSNRISAKGPCKMFSQWHIAQALWDMIIFVLKMFGTAFCNNQTIVSHHCGRNLPDTFFTNGGVFEPIGWGLT